MADSVAAFQGWNSSIQGWDTGTWNTNVAYPVTATAVVNSATVATSGDANVSVTGVAGTGSVGSVTVVGLANVEVTGVSGTSAVGSVTVVGLANVEVTGVSATSAIGVLGTIWGNIIPSQTSNFTNITVAQTPDWVEIEHGLAA